MGKAHSIRPNIYKKDDNINQELLIGHTLSNDIHAAELVWGGH